MKKAAVILTLCVVSAAWAQEGQPPKKRLVFEPGSKEPAPPVFTPPVSDKKDPLDAQVDVFFLCLKAGEVETAYDNLVKNTIIADRPDDVRILKEKTSEALEEYGRPEAYELVEEKKVGTRLVRRTYLSHSGLLPLRWRFYFYRTADGWRLVDFRVDDALIELFEDEPRGRR